MSRPEHELREQLEALSEKTINRRRFVLTGVAGVALAGLLAACGDDDDDDDPDPPVDAPDDDDEPVDPTDDEDDDDVAAPTDDDERYGGRLVVALPTEPGSMDNHVDSAPSAGMVYDNLYDQLLTIDPDGVVEPSLAVSWEVVEDEPTRWHVNLRDDVDWHNGDHFTAEDVKYHFDRVFDPEDPGRPAGLLSAFEDSEVVDEYTIDIITSFPYPVLMDDLVPRWQSISTNRTQIEQTGRADYGSNPVGTGPFKFREWVIGERVEFEANEDYWDGRPYLDEVEWRVIPEASSRLLALRGGEVDFIYVLPRHEVEALQAAGDVNVLTAVTFVTSFISFQTALHPFDDVNVRHAVGYAIDRQEIIDIAFEGQAAIADQFVAPGIAGYNPDLDTTWPYDPERAVELLEEAGWVEGADGVRERDGERFSVEFHYAEGARWPGGVSEVIQNNLGRVGIELRLQRRESAALIAEAPEGIIAIRGSATGLGTGNFGQVSYDYHHRDGGRNYSFLWEVDPEGQEELDALTSAAAEEFDEERRLELWGEVMEANKRYALAIPLYHPLETGATGTHVQDAYLHPGEYIRLQRVWIED